MGPCAMAVCRHYTEPRVTGQGKSSPRRIGPGGQTRNGAECARLALAATAAPAEPEVIKKGKTEKPEEEAAAKEKK